MPTCVSVCMFVCGQCPCGPGVQVLMSTDVSNCVPPEEGVEGGEVWKRGEALI